MPGTCGSRRVEDYTRILRVRANDVDGLIVLYHVGTAYAAPGGIVGGPCARAGRAEDIIIAATNRATFKVESMRFTARFTSFPAPFTTKAHVRRRRGRAEHSDGDFSRTYFPRTDRILSHVCPYAHRTGAEPNFAFD